jgi:hypothetical protein
MEKTENYVIVVRNVQFGVLGILNIAALFEYLDNVADFSIREMAEIHQTKCYTHGYHHI